jgi:hypothetical protein
MFGAQRDKHDRSRESCVSPERLLLIRKEQMQ